MIDNDTKEPLRDYQLNIKRHLFYEKKEGFLKFSLEKN